MLYFGLSAYFIKEPLLLTTVVQKLDQGCPRNPGVMDFGPPFCFFLAEQKEKKRYSILIQPTCAALRQAGLLTVERHCSGDAKAHRAFQS